MKTIPLSRGYEAIVDNADYEWLNQWKWHWHHNGYAVRSVMTPRPNQKCTQIVMHRLIMDAPKGMTVDHINQNKLDNRRSNLRLATRAQNTRNTTARANNKSGYKGVNWNIGVKKWIAQIRVEKKRIHLGVFATPEEAARVYDRAAREYHGEFAGLNFPE